MVTVSIVTPVYNGIEFLEECVNSVLAQTFTDWEMLIGINGHGADGGDAARIAQELVARDSRLKLFIQPPPLRGKVESLNHLVEQACADWICILDCDDKWAPTKLEEQIGVVHGEAADADVIGTYCRYFGERDGMPNIPAGYINPAVLEEYNPIINSSAMVRKPHCTWVYNDINYGVEDFHLWMQICLKNKRLYNIPKILTYHRIHSTSAFNSKHYSDAMIRAEYKALRNNQTTK